MSQISTNLSANKCSFWGICCESGKKYSQIVERRFHISMAALDPAGTLSSHFVSLLVERGGSEYLLCSLHKESQLQVNLDLFFDVGEEVSFSLRGQGTVHLSGYYIHDLNDKTNLKNANDNQNIKQNQFTVSSTKNNLSKTIQSSGVKINAQMKEGRKGKGQQKGAEALMNLSQMRLTVQNNDDSDDEDDSDSDDEDSEDEDIEMFKELWKKGNQKKLKADASTPLQNKKVTFNDSKTPETNTNKKNKAKDELESSIGRTPMPKKPITSSENKKNLNESKKGIQLFKAAESDESESEESSDDDEVQVLPNLSKKRPRTADEEDSDDDSDDMEIFRELAKKGVQKKLKADISTPSKEKKVNASSTPANATNQKIKAKDDLDSSIGRTPMPKKIVSITKLPKDVEDEIVSESDSDEDMDISVGNTLESGKNVSTESSISKKKKKKKKKNAQKEVNAIANETSNILKKDSPIKANGDLSKMQFNKNVGGVAYDDIRIGNGPVAKRGRLVHVSYTGKLENNTVFDSVKPGERPFSFKLGVGQVVTGWDLAIEGMKVGGKRKFKVPPHLGYKNARVGDIPPNSTLYFEVELKAVS
ncbi:FK506-binding protein 4 [Caerostris darwini]|uniref:peptidylprolyl isomerase n=1 Tax=Caerostris darwini TaxID=1538125 RepID=A0AAV4NII4_9ARAC|nr:FK506-binding protein 4 [Caerostris darwini]